MNLSKKLEKSILNEYLPQFHRNGLILIVFMMGISLAGFGGVRILKDTFSLRSDEMFIFWLFVGCVMACAELIISFRLFTKKTFNLFIFALLVIIFFTFQAIRVVFQNSTTITPLNFIFFIILFLITYWGVKEMGELFQRGNMKGKMLIVSWFIISLICTIIWI